MPRPLNTELGGTGRNDGQLNFTQSGTGAVTRGSNDKLAELVSVKDFGAVLDGVTDDTAAINSAATAARASGHGLIFPMNGTALVSGSLDFTGIYVLGIGRQHIHIQATSAQFDIITSQGNTTLDGLYVHGGWDGTTAGQNGDIISIVYASPNNPYTVHLKYCTLQFAKKRAIYWERGGYSSCYAVKVNACGLHGIELYGVSGTDSFTTLSVGGQSVFSDCPNGYGAKITNCISVGFDNVIIENTNGIQLNGSDNRSLSFKQVYQEGTSGGVFITDNSSAGIGLTLESCFGGTTNMSALTNWIDAVDIGGNSSMTVPALPDSNRLLSADSGQQTSTTTGGFDTTVTSISVPPGSWMMFASIQTLDAAASTIVRASCQITTNSGDSGLANNTSGTFIVGADEARYTPLGGQSDIRLNCWAPYRNTGTSNVSVYLRAGINISAGTIAYRGQLYAVRL